MSDDEERGSEDEQSAEDEERAEPKKKSAEASSGVDRQRTTRRDKRPAPRRRGPGKRAVSAESAADPADDVVAPKALGGAVRLAEEKAARRLLFVGVTLAIAGLALVGTGPSEVGMALSLAGLLALIYGIHTFGRLGPAPAR